MRARSTARASRFAFLRNCASDCCSGVTAAADAVDETGACTTAGAGLDSPAEARGLLPTAHRIEPAASAATMGETTAAADQLARVGPLLVIVALVVVVVLVLVVVVLVVVVVIVLVVLVVLVLVVLVLVFVVASGRTRPGVAGRLRRWTRR